MNEFLSRSLLLSNRTLIVLVFAQECRRDNNDHRMDMSRKNLDYVNVVNVVARPMLLYIQVYDDESYSFFA